MTSHYLGTDSTAQVGRRTSVKGNVVNPHSVLRALVCDEMLFGTGKVNVNSDLSGREPSPLPPPGGEGKA